MQGVDLILKYFPELNAQQKERFAALGPLYRAWNSKINVVSRKDMDNLYERHVLHALGIAKVYQFKDGSRILDVGTGGGFPGIPLAILFPNVRFHLIDGTGKKILVVNEVIQALGLENAKGQQIRSEDLDGAYDHIVSRAVTNLPNFMHLTYHLLKKKGTVLYLKGGEIREEMEAIEPMPQYYPLSEHFDEEHFDTKGVVII